MGTKVAAMSAKPFIPRPYQKTMINHMINHKRCALFAQMGLGKSSSVLSALVKLNLIEDVFPALIIAPLRVAQSVWPEEIRKWASFNHLKVSVITGDAMQRKKALSVKADIFCTNYEQIPNLVKLFGTKWPFRCIIADEGSKLKGFRIRQGTKRSKELYKVSFPPYCNRFVELSGTPCSSGLESLYGQLHFLDQGERLGRTFTSFEQRWFARSWDGFSIKPLPHAQKEIEDKIKDICLSVKSEDHFDLQKPIVNKIYVDLPKEARAHYNNMEQDLFTELSGESIEAFSAAAKTMKLLQFSNGAAYINGKNEEWEIVHDEKIRALESIIEEAAGMPVLVAYHFRSDLKRLCDAFPQGRALDKNPQTIRDWNEGNISLLFAHPASAGHGINLARGSNMLAFFSVNWNLEEHLQIIERIGPVRQAQEGLNRSVHLHYILARNTIDDIVMERLESKKSVQELLMNALRRIIR